MVSAFLSRRRFVGLENNTRAESHSPKNLKSQKEMRRHTIRVKKKKKKKRRGEAGENVKPAYKKR